MASLVMVVFSVVLLFGSGVKRHVGKKACLFKSRGVKRHVVKSQSVNWHAVFRQSMKKGMSPLGFIRIQPQFKVNDSTPKYSAQQYQYLSPFVLKTCFLGDPARKIKLKSSSSKQYIITPYLYMQLPSWSNGLVSGLFTRRVGFNSLLGNTFLSNLFLYCS